ncbi:hypothetical protein EDB86DRAFT_2812217, partial [Lactarius hatsudake]
EIKLEGEELRKQIDSKAEKDRPISCPVYYEGEAISSQERPISSPGHLDHAEGERRSRFVFERDSVRHDGIKVKFVGNIGAYTSLQPLSGSS